MRLSIRITTTLALIGLAAWLTVTVPDVLRAQPPTAAKGKGPAKGPVRPPDPRVQQRTYVFEDTGEKMPYALFVSSKVSPDRKNPLIVALHGYGGDGNALLRGEALDLAEEGGYILVGPMGYNETGWYGSPVIIVGGGGGKGNSSAIPEPPNLAELSEKDVLNVLHMMQQEFNVDEDRTYLMGHSMGGAGALFMGPKYVDTWAAVASMAPAAFRMDPETLGPVKDKMPLLLLHGDADTVVPVDVSRRWNQAATNFKMKDFVYHELPGADHGTVITQGIPEIFEYFEAYSK